MTPSGQSCECCEREQAPGETWTVGPEGEEVCPECFVDLSAAMQEQIAKLPRRIGLCPEHASEFYYPLGDGEGHTCPQCSLEMVVYEKAGER